MSRLISPVELSAGVTVDVAVGSSSISLMIMSMTFLETQIRVMLEIYNLTNFT